MGFSRCSQCCERSSPDGRSCSAAWIRPEAIIPTESRPPSDLVEQLTSLSYAPPPALLAPDRRGPLEELLDPTLPKKPPPRLHGTPPAALQVTEASSRSASSRPTCARPGEPVNQVYVQFSNDLEGFLPYTLVISEEQGLEFTSLSSSPDFTLDPLHILKVERISYDKLMHDAFFMSLSRNIFARPELQLASNGGQQQNQRQAFEDVIRAEPSLKERVRPPYTSVVQLSIRRTLHEGGQVLVFIAVQSEPLAEELERACHQLKKRRAVRNAGQDVVVDDAMSYNHEMSLGVVSRGYPTPRTAVSVQKSQVSTPSPTPGALSPARPAGSRMERAG